MAVRFSGDADDDRPGTPLTRSIAGCYVFTITDVFGRPRLQAEIELTLADA